MSISPGIPPISAYLEAQNNLNKTTQKIEATITFVNKAATLLTDWKNLTISTPEIEFPSELDSSPIIDGTEWPSAQTLANILIQWHSEAQTARKAWRLVPTNSQRNLEPPP